MIWESDSNTNNGTQKMFYALQINANNTRNFFEGESETIDGLKTLIAAWKSQVTPRMAEKTKFEIRHDSNIEVTIETI
jgi:hypothetical protein